MTTQRRGRAFEQEETPDIDERTDPRFRDRIGDRIDSILPDTVKKMALAGLGAVFMTEEGIRNAVTELRLPREAVGTLLAQTEKARAELFRLIAAELRDFLEEANLAGELRKVLLGLSVDVQASVSFRSAEEGSITASVKRKTSTRSSTRKRSKKASGPSRGKKRNE